MAHSAEKILDFIKLILNYISSVCTAIPQDFISELHLRHYKNNKLSTKRILGYWDFNQRLNTTGDVVIFLEILEVLRLSSTDGSNRNIDLCFIDDDSHYNADQIRFSKPYNWKMMMKSLTITSPNLDSLLFFKSNSEFNNFYVQNRERYIRWPPTVSGTQPIDCRVIAKFYDEHGFIPYLKLPDELLSDAYEFYKQHVYPALPIILNIRNNSRDSSRNSNLAEVKKFIENYEDNTEYKFVIVCNKSEIPEDFRKLKNVVFSKDYFSSIEQDLALINTSYLTIVPGSGMSAFTWFANIPFIQYGNYEYGFKIPFKGTRANNVPQKGKQYSFFQKYQRFYHRAETSDWLISVFEDLVKYLKDNNINNNSKHKVKNNKKYRGLF